VRENLIARSADIDCLDIKTVDRTSLFLRVMGAILLRHRVVGCGPNLEGKLMIPFPNKKYQVIYADPPWKESGGGKIRRGADAHYKLMSTKEIMTIPVQNISDDNAHLYLWVTNSFLVDGLKVMDAWGFRYVTKITWFKDRFGLGQYFRGITEDCLFGVRGMLPYKSENGKRCQGITGFFEKRKEHSRKPETMKRMIEHVSCREHTKQIELFARKKRGNGQVEMFRGANGFAGGSRTPYENLPRFGTPVTHYSWDAWGNEV